MAGTNNIWDFLNNGSFASQYNTAGNKIKELKALGIDSLNESQKKELAGMKAAQGQAILGGVTAGLQGLTQIGGSMQQLSSIADTAQQNYQVQQLRNLGTQNYSSLADIQNAYGQLNTTNVNWNEDEIRGMDTGQQLAGIGSATLSGATAGAQIGGPVGAIVGGAAGLLGSTGAAIAGNIKAKRVANIGRMDTANAQAATQIGLNAAIDTQNNAQARQDFQRRQAKGGNIHRMTVTEFAELVNKRRQAATRNNSLGIVRQHCNGGTMIRIKR